jgi:hypothetical protein
MKKNMTYDIGNPGPDLGEKPKCGEVNPVNGIPTLPISNDNTDINKR